MKEYQTIDERAVIKTLEVLRNRVAERFPSRGLAQSAAYLLDIARVTAREAASLRNPNWGLRILSAIAIAAAAFGFIQLITFLQFEVPQNTTPLTEFAQGLEATLNILLISGLFIAFFMRIENRVKRKKALAGLYRLRAISHVIDMHQLTKDPEQIAGKTRTTSSPVRDLSTEQLLRYLDYCSEMLSLTGKLAALYAQYFPDATVVAAVNDVEQLTTNLSRKIWQKIVLAQQSSAE